MTVLPPSWLRVIVEYTDWISTDGWDFPNEGPKYETKQSNGEDPIV